MLTADDVREALRSVPDPEMPISIVDLGIVHDVRVERAGDGQRVEIDLIPTFVGCPALDVIEQDVRRRLLAAPTVREVVVRFLHSPAWSADRISAAGRESLRRHGVVVPRPGACGAAADREAAMPVTLTVAESEPTPCPYCGSDRTQRESIFGPTRCRMIYYCDACRNSFERIKSP
jgi:ring-1,2-phenylacetyl-CoA epoxidase subunit PaaD